MKKHGIIEGWSAMIALFLFYAVWYIFYRVVKKKLKGRVYEKTEKEEGSALDWCLCCHFKKGRSDERKVFLLCMRNT